MKRFWIFTDRMNFTVIIMGPTQQWPSTLKLMARSPRTKLLLSCLNDLFLAFFVEYQYKELIFLEFSATKLENNMNIIISYKLRFRFIGIKKAAIVHFFHYVIKRHLLRTKMHTKYL